MKNGIRRVVPVMAAALACACAVAPPSSSPAPTGTAPTDPRLDLRQHAVFVHHSGRPLRVPVDSSGPDGNLRLGRIIGHDVMDTVQYDRYLHEMMDSLRNRPDVPVLLYAHGGLNTLNGSRARGEALLQKISPDSFFPIFINWNSGMFATLGEHVFWVRQGERKVWGPLTAPAALASGLVNSVAAIPATTAGQIGDGLAPVTNRDPLRNRTYDSLRARFGDTTEIKVSQGEVSLPFSLTRVPGMVLFPLRMAEAPLLAGFGGPAWENMQRRISMMFRSEIEADEARRLAASGTTGYLPPTGAVGVLMDSLSAVLRATPGRKVVLMGHSMGAIVMNEMVERYPDLPASDIVYMAPASSVRDLETSIIPFMQRHDSTNFYILTLHERADRREKAFRTDFIPGGSLLEWLDDYLMTPRTPLDRRLGKWQNIIEHQYVFPANIRRRVHIKAFGIGDATVRPYENRPTRHGHFDDSGVPFWTRTFWEPAPPAPSPGARP